MNNLVLFDEKIPVSSSIFIVRCGYLWGLVSNGSLIMNPTYDYIWTDSDGLIWATYNGKSFVVDTRELPTLYDYVEKLNDGHFLVYKDELVGVCDANMNEIITPTFSKVIEHDAIYWCCIDKELELCNLYTKSGEIITKEPILYNPASFPIIVSQSGENIIGNAYQYLLPVNVKLIKQNYDWLDPQKKDPVGIITTEGCQLLYVSTSNTYIDIAYSKIKSEHSLFFCYRGEEKVCFNECLSSEGDYYEEDFVDIYDKNGCLIAELDLSIYSTDRCFYYNEQLTLLSRRNKRFGVIDSTGIIIPFRYHNITRRHGISLTRKLRYGVREQEEFIIAEVHYKQNDNIIKEYDVYNSEGKCIIHGLQYQQDKLILNPNDSTNIIVQSGNKFTAYTRDGKRIKTIYNIEALGEFNNHGLAIAKSETGHVALVNINLERQTSFIYVKFSKSDVSDHVILGVCNRSHYIFIKDGKARPLLYNQIEHGKHDFLLVSNGHPWDDNIRWGVVNNEGSEIIGCSYREEDIAIIDTDTIIIPTDNNAKIAVDKYGNDKGLTEEDLEALLPIVERRNSKGQPVVDLYTQFGGMCFGYQRVKNHDDKWGFIDSNNDEVTPFMYDFVWDMSEHGLAAVKTESGCGIIDKTGKYILLPGYSGADYNHSFITPEDIDRTFVVIKDGKYGLLFPGFKEALPPIYDKLNYNLGYVNYSSETGLIHACKEGKYGILMIENDTVTTLIECLYDSLEYFTNETLSDVHSEIYFIGKRDIDGTVQGDVFNIEGEIVDSFNGDLILKFAHENTFAYADTSAYYYDNIIVKHQSNINNYNRIYELRGRYLVVKNNGKYGIYDTIEGKEVISCKYEDGSLEFKNSGDIVPVKINGKFGFIDINDRIILEPKYERAGVFSDGLAAVSLNGKWGYVNLKGEQVIPYIYEYAGKFSSGLARVQKGNLYGYIDRFNNVIIPFRYTDARNFSKGIASVATENYRSKITPKGIEIGYEQIRHYSSRDDDYDYERDTWDAMTDGQYGDYPGSGVNYDGLGF